MVRTDGQKMMRAGVGYRLWQAGGRIGRQRLGCGYATVRHGSTGSLSELLDIPIEDDLSIPAKRGRFPPSTVVQGNGIVTSQGTKPPAHFELFDAIVHDGVPVLKMKKSPGGCCVLPCGGEPDLRTDERLTEQLARAEKNGDPEDALDVLDNILEAGLIPTAGTYLRIIELCTRNNAIDHAEDLLDNHTPFIHAYEQKAAVYRSARCAIALAHLAEDKPKRALSILKWAPSRPRTREEVTSENETIHERLDAMELGVCEVAWGCVIRALTKLDSKLAVEVANIATSRNVPLTATMTFFTLEALRANGRWADADALLEASPRAPDRMHERMVGSVLRALTAPHARKFVEPERVVTLAASIENPTIRFNRVALLSLCAVGRSNEARAVFNTIYEQSKPKAVDERAYSVLIGCYCAAVDIGPPSECVEVQAWYRDLCDELDEVWERYRVDFSHKPKKTAMEARSRAFQRVLWAKSRALHVAEACDMLDDACGDPALKAEFNVGRAHFAAVLSGAELTCDTKSMKRVLEVMQREGVHHDPRTVAFVIGASLGTGDVAAACKVVSEEAPRILESLRHERDYRVALLLRRLEMLKDAVRDARLGNDTQDEVCHLMRRLKRHLNRRDEGFRPSRGWR